MVNDVINGVTKTLHDNFEGVTIYTDAVPQKLEVPCFFVMAPEVSERRLLSNRSMFNIGIEVHFLSDKNQQIQLVGSKLYSILRKITLLNGEQLHGFKLNYRVNDSGILIFTVNFKPIVYYAVESVDKMGRMEHKI